MLFIAIYILRFYLETGRFRIPCSNQNCFQTEEGLYDPELRFDGKVVLPIPTLIISEPVKCARVAGYQFFVF